MKMKLLILSTILTLLGCVHDDAYYKDEAAMLFLNTNAKGEVDTKRIEEIKAYQKKVWGKDGKPQTKTLYFDKNGIFQE